ncbi:amidohydrolase family protein [Actinomadura sp. BRA 177]|uniref:amidohydrolase family protein n=1 Tax=Actinomadura sp. BRA 177 TaxID=2745202 RepID=UPI0015959E23|nr:amidohydrolase family protein [Actinomadura sp. BRA 177]NVI91608.1 amidohydrolase family protein [Actinomadura sp. BRA 177]
MSDLRELRLADYIPRPSVELPGSRVPRPRFRCVDAHNHLGRWLTEDGGWMAPEVGLLIALMDEHHVDAIVNLDGMWGEELSANLDRYDRAHPGRFRTFCQLDWNLLREHDGIEHLVSSLANSRTLGARGLKVWKTLGLHYTGPDGRLVLPDDPMLAPVFDAAGDLGPPVLIHTADPVAFFAPVDRHNERLEELLANPGWHFGRPGLPTFARLMDALEGLVTAHPRTTFIGAHVGCYAEDLRWVSRMLDEHPNFHIDIAGRIAELGRRPRAARALLLRHPDRVLFGTDAFPLSASSYPAHFRFLETADEHFPYSPEEEVPPQGRWTVSALDLPADVLEMVYAGNALRLLQ